MLTYAGAGSCNRMRSSSSDSAGAYTDYTDAYNYTLYTAPLQVSREHSIAAYARLPATPTTPPPLLPRSLACHTYTAPSLAPQVSCLPHLHRPLPCSPGLARSLTRRTRLAPPVLHEHSIATYARMPRV
jgi:hypothetical protein